MIARHSAWGLLAIAAGLCAGQTLAGSRPAERPPALEWSCEDCLESVVPPHEYSPVGDEYAEPADGREDPGRNLMLRLKVDWRAAPKRLARVLTRDSTLRGRIARPPAEAEAGWVRLEDRFGRILDRAEVKPGAWEFYLESWRSLSTGLKLRAELTAAGEPIWSAEEAIRMTAEPQPEAWEDFLLSIRGTGETTAGPLRRLGVGAAAVERGANPLPAVDADLRIHAAGIGRSLLGLYRGDLRRWRQVRRAQIQARGPVEFARHRCLSDPAEARFLADAATIAGMKLSPYRPLFYGLGPAGVGRPGAPVDLCGSKWCLARFRKWLEARYRTLDRLNAHWGTDYETWSEVPAFSIRQALERAGDGGNFAPWAERLTFSNAVLTEGLATARRSLRKVDPDARCGLGGVVGPSCWNGDLWRLTRVADVMSPRRPGLTGDILASFYGDGRFGRVAYPAATPTEADLWRALLQGYDMVRLAEPPADRAAGEWAAWVHAGPGRLRNRALRHRHPVAILYSQPSLRGNWLLEVAYRDDMPHTGDEWTARTAQVQRRAGLTRRVWLSWSTWLQDVGVTPRYVDVSQVDDGLLLEENLKVLILPRAVALSDRTARAIRKFVESGGTVIADAWPGIMDETCRIRRKGALDELFGVTRGDFRDVDVRPVPAGGEGVAFGSAALPFQAFEKTLRATTGRPAGQARRPRDRGKAAPAGPPILIRRGFGLGRTVYLNFNMEQYFLQRLTPADLAAARPLLLDLLAEAGVRPEFAVVPPGTTDPHPVGHEICLYRSGRGWLVGLRQNPTAGASDLLGIPDRYRQPRQTPFAGARPAELRMPPGRFAYDLRTRKAIKGNRLRFESRPDSPRLIACWPFEITGLEVHASSTPKRTLRVVGRIATSGEVRDERLVVSMRAFRPDGTEQPIYRRTIDCRHGRFAAEIPLGLNERGEWTVVVTEPCTGRAVRRTVRIR
jgi:hypothetical protein